MGVAYNSRIITDGLVLALDAANPRNFNLTAVEVLVVAGGGGGGTGGGGGGAGGLIYNSNFAVTPGTQLTATVGDGGAIANSWGAAGGFGSNSVFGSLTAIGGGAGLHRAGATNSGTGGSGGGDAGGSGYTLSNATAGQGFSGGNSPKNGDTLEEPGGGGGGAGGPGESALTPTASDNVTVRATAAGAGGPGLGFSISGTFTYYAGGGGGSNRNGVGRSGGLGGGGTGGTSPTAGTPNTGGGGGGTGYSGYGGGGTSGAGGSGIIIVRYPGPQKAIGGTVTSVNGDTIHTFTTSGNFTPLVNTNGSAVLGLSDLSGNRNFGTTANGPTYSSANGGSLVFDGTNDYVTTSLVTSLSNNVTISSWFRTFNASQAGQMVIYNGSDANGNGYGFAVNNESTTNGEILLLYGAIAWINTGFFAASNVIYNATMVIESDNSNKLYINGNLVHSGISRNINTPTNHTEIGRNDYPAARYFNGNIAQTQIYNRALSAAEIAQNYNSLRGRFGI